MLALAIFLCSFAGSKKRKNWREIHPLDPLTAEFITPTIALFANATAADFKNGDIIMFAMGSSSRGRVAPRADQSLEGQFACAPMYYGVFSTIVDVTNGGCGC